MSAARGANHRHPGGMTGWRPALRVARRSVRRHTSRSLLIIALIALPVMAATAADGIIRTLTDRETDLNQAMGTADAHVTLYSRKKVDLGRFLPPGSRVVPVSSPNVMGNLRLSVGDRIVRSRLDLVVLGDPLTAHLARLTDGRLPANAREALVTRPLAEKLGLLDADGALRPHSTAGPHDGPRVTVTGLAIEPYCLSCVDVVAPPDTVLTRSLLDHSPVPVGYLVDLPPGADPAALARAWPVDAGTFTTRESFEDTTPFGGYVADALTQPILLFAALALIGIVITAGAAFAVGTRSQLRDLGLLAVNGGENRHVRRIVLAQGVVLGVLGSATGLVVGAVVMVLGVPLWQRITGQLMENPHFGWGELAIAAAVGILASVAAAVVPAFTVGRMRPADALAGRFAGATPRARVRLLGLATLLAGMAAIVVSGVVSRTRLAEHDRQIARYGSAGPLDRTLPFAGTIAGVAVAVVGLVLVLPAVLAAVGRLGDRLPLSGRLAVRDAVRHRYRTGAACLAIMVTITCSVVTAFVFTARSAAEPKALPANTAIIEFDQVSEYRDSPAGRRTQLAAAAAHVTRAVPGAVTVPITVVTPDADSVLDLWLDTRDDMPTCDTFSGRIAVGTPELIELATGRPPDAAVRTALAEGKAVSYDKCLVSRDGTVTLTAKMPDRTTLPAHLAATAYPAGTSAWSLPTVFLSPEAIAAHGWFQTATSTAVTYPASTDLDAVRTAADDAGMDLWAGDSVGPPTDGYLTGLYYLLAGLAAVVAFLGAGVTVALSATDGRADLATLAALGASGYRRRTLAGSHALVVTGLGALSGLVVGLCAAFAAVPVMGMPTLVVPWEHLLVTVLAVPVVASMTALAVTPSRLPLARRS